MAGGSTRSNPTKQRKRVEAEAGNGNALLRARDGSAFARCEECKKNVPVALISMHSCSLDAKIRMNLEAQVVEKSTETQEASAERKRSKSDEPKKKLSSDEPKAKRLKKLKDKKAKDTNKPKRPPTAFFLFMDDFRKSYKEENPGSNAPKEVVKLGGEKWKSMSEEEKKPYLDKAAGLKEEYKKSLGGNTDAEEGANTEKETEKVDEDTNSDKVTEDEEAGKNADEKENDEKEEVLDDY